MADGEAVPATQRDGKRWRYPIRRGVKAIRLRSGSGVPAELLPDSHDKRRLGLWIDGVAIIRDGGRRDVPLADAALTDGWHDVEQADNGAWRWTDGDAGLAVKGPCELEISAGCAVVRWAPPAIGQDQRRARAG